MMFSGVLFIQVFSPLVMERVTLMSGTLTETLKPLWLERRLALELLMLSDGVLMVGELPLVMLMVMLVSGE
jgi:hypothetical protein